MNDQPKSLRDAMDAAARALDLTAETVNSPTAPQENPPARSEADDGVRLLKAGERLLRDRQAILAARKAAYELRRTERMNFYASEVARLEDEAEAELLAMQRSWHEEQNKLGGMIAKLKALRDG